MGHGYGDLQRQLLRLLKEHEATKAPPYRGLDTPTLAERLRGREPTRSELVSIRRALHTLKRDGRVDHLDWRWEHRHHWRRTAEERERG